MKLELEVDTCVGLGDSGNVECFIFTDDGNVPAMSIDKKLEALTLEFIELRQAQGCHLARSLQWSPLRTYLPHHSQVPHSYH